MEPVVGAVCEGRVTGITNFGAFVALEGGKSGLVHISEVAGSYVNDVHDHLTVGQTVKVRVMNMTEDGKINLSIKRAVEEAPRRSAPAPRQVRSVPENAPTADQDFESRLKKFMQESDSRIADNPKYTDHRQRNRHR